MIRKELVAKDLIQKGERHKNIVQKSPYHEGESITNFQSNALKKSKKEKLEDQIPQSRTSTSPYYLLARTSTLVCECTVALCNNHRTL